MNLDNFDWGHTSEEFKIQVTKEVFDKNDYEYCFQVEENDIVVDIGATIGEFTYKILDRNPKHCYVVEPVGVFFDTMKNNLQGHQVSFTNAAITNDKCCSIECW
jgi:tRNA G46 methylase TrmB